MKNKFKIVAFILVIVCVASIAYGCGINNTESGVVNSTPITTITASAVETFDFNFEAISFDRGSLIVVYRETTTDTIWVERYSSTGIGIVQFNDPETGKPLTYSVWLEKYANK